MRQRPVPTIGLISLAALAVAGLAVAGGESKAAAPAAPAPAAAKNAASVVLEPTQGSQVRGTITFTAAPGGVRVVADLSGLTPGAHGFHVHDKGDCSAPDATSAGGHFNPGGTPHGAPDAEKHHAGDLGNITAGDDGKAHLDQIFPFLSLSGPDSIVGRGFIVHAGKDDMTTQPTGNAGARAACGVIKAG
ncbi:MAG TPA: superoxide dismutase family protein [Patescibacteria group bacterium]|nr:superoxide dismutase family protein [Patescibacteria group bacterium]